MAARDNYYDYNPQAQTYDPYSNQYQQPQYPQYPPQQPYPPPPQYPPQQYPAYPPPQKKSNIVLIVVVILIIVFVIIPVVMAGILYVWVSGFETEGGGVSVKISSIISDKDNAFQITIISVSGGTLNLDEAEFQIADENGILKYKLNLYDTNPDSVSSGEAVIYPMTAGSSVVTDGLGGPLDGNDDPIYYQNCAIAYIDKNKDQKISADDLILIYKDNNNDEIYDVESKFTFKIIDAFNEVVHSKQL